MAAKEIKLGDLKGNPNNPRFIKEANVEYLKKSLKSLGDLSCIVYNERFSRLVGGHQRSNVIQKLIGENPTIKITNEYKEPNEVQTTKEGYIEIGTEHYKVRFVDFSEEDEALAVIIANDRRNQGEYDVQLLPTMCDLADHSLLATDFDILDFVEGFNFDVKDFEPDTEKVEFEAGKGGEKTISFVLSETDYYRALDRLRECKEAQSLDTDEEAFTFIFFA